MSNLNGTICVSEDPGVNRASLISARPLWRAQLTPLLGLLVGVMTKKDVLSVHTRWSPPQTNLSPLLCLASMIASLSWVNHVINAMVRPWLMGACILLSVEAPALCHVVYVLMLHVRWRWTLDPRTGVFFWSIKVVLWRFHSLHNHLCCCYTVKFTRNGLVLQVPDQSLTNTGGCNYSWDLHTRPLLWTIFVICKRCALLDFSVCLRHQRE